MSRTYRHKLPYLDKNNKFNIKISRGLHSEKLQHKDPDIYDDEVSGLYRKREAKKRMAKKHRQNTRVVLRERLRDYYE